MKSKAHLIIPQEILAEVDRIAGKRRRSLFFAEATREKGEKILQRTAEFIGEIIEEMKRLPFQKPDRP